MEEPSGSKKTESYSYSATSYRYLTYESKFILDSVSVVFNNTLVSR